MNLTLVARCSLSVLLVSACGSGPVNAATTSATSGSGSSTSGAVTGSTSGTATGSTHSSTSSTSATTSGAASTTGTHGTTSSGATSTSGHASTTSGSTSGAGSTTGGASCPRGQHSCVPANICDNGCAVDGGACVDETTANQSQTGVGCDAGSVCEGTICFTTSGPQVPNQGGGVLANPHIVLMTYANDSNQSAIEQWTVWISDGGFLTTTIGQYGVGTATVQFVNLTDTPPDQSSIEGYLQTHLDSNPTMPADAPNNIYLIVFPASWPSTSSFCTSQGGYYHSVFQATNGSFPIYAVVADCGGGVPQIEVSASHEIAEASTDAYGQGWVFYGDAAWQYIGGEIGDMCESNSDYYAAGDGGVYAAQVLWSNAAAAAGQVPCQPWPSGHVYLSIIGPTELVPAAPGTVAQIPLTAWANQPTGAWGVAAQDAFYGVSFQTNPVLSAMTVNAGNRITVSLSVPTAAPGTPALGGNVGAAWIFNGDSSNTYYGAAVVGVVVSCATTGDCSDETTICELTGGVGSCQSNPCGAAATAFAACNAQGTGDGVCQPSYMGRAVCTQAGTLATGDAGCLLTRVVDAESGAYCAPALSCQGQTNPLCLAWCNADGGVTGCSAGDDCVPMGPNFGSCAQDCTTTNTCPANETCYQISATQSACFPN